MSLTVRALLALVLMAAFYALAFAAVVGLVWGGVAIATGGARGTPVVDIAMIAMFGAAAIIAWSMLPRLDRFTPPGPELSPDTHPELFAEIQRISQEVGERAPQHVYVGSAVNAFVAQRGGIAGLGARRVMGLGLPLMRVLTVSELRAVIAHEMGHFSGGDIRLGPRIYRTRGAVIRTHDNLVRVSRRLQRADMAPVSNIASGVLFVVRLPFMGFAWAFLRITQVISRSQELTADRLAARHAGIAPAIAALEKTDVATLAHVVYMHTEIIPLVDEGVLPPVGEGFAAFVVNARAELETESKDAADPYDSHPPTRERIEALRGLDTREHDVDARPATALFRDVNELERNVFTQLLDKRVEAIAWADTPTIWAKRWRRQHDQLRSSLGAFTVATLPTARVELERLVRAVARIPLRMPLRDLELQRWAITRFGMVLAVILLDAGFVAETPPGSPVVLKRGDEAIAIFDEVRQRVVGKVDEQVWHERWTRIGLADRSLDGDEAGGHSS